MSYGISTNMNIGSLQEIDGVKSNNTSSKVEGPATHVKLPDKEDDLQGVEERPDVTELDGFDDLPTKVQEQLKEMQGQLEDLADKIEARERKNGNHAIGDLELNTWKAQYAELEVEFHNLLVKYGLIDEQPEKLPTPGGSKIGPLTAEFGGNPGDEFEEI